MKDELKRICSERVMKLFREVNGYYERLHDENPNIEVPPVRTSPGGTFAFTDPHNGDYIVGKMREDGWILWMARSNNMTNDVTLTNISMDRFLEDEEAIQPNAALIKIFAECFQRIMSYGKAMYDAPLTIVYDGSLRRIKREGVWTVTHDTSNYKNPLVFDGIDEREFVIQMMSYRPTIGV